MVVGMLKEEEKRNAAANNAVKDGPRSSTTFAADGSIVFSAVSFAEATKAFVKRVRKAELTVINPGYAGTVQVHPSGQSTYDRFSKLTIDSPSTCTDTMDLGLDQGYYEMYPENHSMTWGIDAKQTGAA